jgi:hypothetical protein
MKKFWMVLGAGTPVYRHPTEKSARTEAERLAGIHPGATFTVLEAISSVQVGGVVWKDHDELVQEDNETGWRLADGGDIGDEVLLSDDGDALGILVNEKPESIKSASLLYPKYFMRGHLSEIRRGEPGVDYRFYAKDDTPWVYAYTNQQQVPF